MEMMTMISKMQAAGQPKRQKKQEGAIAGAETFRDMLSQGDRDRLDKYEKAYMEALTEGQCVPKPVVDLSQNVSVRGKLSDSVPSLLTRCTIWSFKHNRFLTVPEAFQLMGWPVYFDEHGAFPFEHDAFFPEYSAAQLQKAVGNSFHCRLVGLWLCL